ncbi:SDR family oxidoreductase [Paenibacillus doosanensis]|uniref:3-oxoacyl-[acyl-carrier-protein] reductase FabG n=1 Tax=Paenibacillus konkukensis TaxID=2020716 RepID=A0ABY4S1F9_9BACL|nr:MULTISPECIES: SDR family oxidoreductase [Paenibacillus]MCS7464947.1 SDR family oxidoreductase [Paenibacillus doosanensis]UQZ87589.1 3-oxoacyl-[acyl-carrier-protein] reductase FabG [Paenibacillus konkukensis]
MEQRLQGHIAVVTGASRREGIGTAICRSLASAGADIFFTVWREYDDSMPWGSEREWAGLLRNEIQAMGRRCESIEIDLSDANAPARLLDSVSEKLGSPTILVNNATHDASNGYMNVDAKSFDKHYEVNVRATCLLCVEFARRFKKENCKAGRIVNLTSGQEQGPMIGSLEYVATKGAISAFTRSLAPEIASLGITVNAVNPGPTDTGWMTDSIKQHLLPRFPTGRIGLPEDTARLITFLASDEAEWITGQVIHSEGGFIRA